MPLPRFALRKLPNPANRIEVYYALRLRCVALRCVNVAGKDGSSLLCFCLPYSTLL